MKAMNILIYNTIHDTNPSFFMNMTHKNTVISDSELLTLMWLTNHALILNLINLTIWLSYLSLE